MDRRALQRLAETWRTTAQHVTADMRGTVRNARYFKPTGVVKAKMATQVSVLITCATSLEALLDE